MNIFGITEVGSLADWVTSVIAFLAFVAAGIATVATIRTNRAQQQTLELQRKQYEESQQQLRQSQAEKVSVWSDLQPIGQMPDDRKLYRFGAFVLNASDSPIYDVDVLSPKRDADGLTICAHLNSILPTGTDSIFLEIPGGPQIAAPQGFLALHFKDASGTAWVRLPNGELREPSSEELRELSRVIADDFAEEIGGCVVDYGSADS